MESSIRSNAATRKKPTPDATARISTILGTEGTCCASTCRSGSESVITNPMIKPTRITMLSFLLFVIVVPTLSPIGVMERSTPIEKSSIPTIRSTPPIRNAITILGEIGAMVKQSRSTIAMIGNTAFRVSTNFSLNFDLLILNNNRRLSVFLLCSFLC